MCVVSQICGVHFVSSLLGHLSPDQVKYLIRAMAALSARERSPRRIIQMQIVIKPKVGKRFTLDVAADDTIDIVKAKIQGYIVGLQSPGEDSGEDMPPALQRLSFGREQLIDGGRSLSSYGVGHLGLVRLRWDDNALEYHNTCD